MFQGRVMGGQQPIADSGIQLYAVNSTSQGGASTVLIHNTITTSDGTGIINSNSNIGNLKNTLPVGSFTITGQYTCPSADTLVYLVATGGNPGMSSGTKNTAITLMAALGYCGELSSSTFITINEVTTVGTVAGLTQFMSAYNAVGATGSAWLPLEFSVAAEYMNSANGVAPGPSLPSGYYGSSTEVNTLANVVAACVNSSSNTSSACTSLFADAKPSGGTAPTETAGALLDIMNNPTNNVSAIYNLSGSVVPFQPVLTSAPPDWSLPILPYPTAPDFTPVAGSYVSAQSVTMSSTTNNVSIYYTTDGSTPTTSSTLYSSPISVAASQTLKAIAVNRVGGGVGSVSYTITGAAATPVISLASGTYTSTQAVTITSPTLDASIYFTLDGTTPSASSLLYTGGVQVSRSETLKAVAIRGSSTSGVASAAYALSANFSGEIATVAGGGPQTPSSVATSALLYSPEDVAIDSSGNLYIADTSNSRIRKVNLVTGIITTIVGTDANGYVASQDGGLAVNANLASPFGLALDASDNLYIADTNDHRIRRVDALTGIITTVAGTGTAGYVASQDGGPATSAELNNPKGVAVDAMGNLYIADTFNHRIRRVDGTTGTITTVAGTGTHGYVASQDGGPATSAEVNYPQSICLDFGGNVYIADTNNNRVRMVAAYTGIITTVAGTGTPGYDSSQNDGPATSAELYSPRGVVVDSSGDLFIADAGNSVIRVVRALSGIIQPIAGTGTAGSSATKNGGLATSSTLNSPDGLTLDQNGNVYFADTGNNVIRTVPVINLVTLFISNVAGTGQPGYASIGDGGAADNAHLFSPTSTAFDSSGNLYIADTYHSLVRKVDAIAGTITTVAGVPNLIEYVASQDGGPATSAQINTPMGVAVDSSGNLYIGDEGNDRIRKVTASTGIITTIAGNGKEGYVASQDGGPAVDAELHYPSGVVLDTSGNLYFADMENERIRKINLSTGIITTVAGNGVPGYRASDDGGPATSAEFYVPNSVAVDGSGNLYIADTGNNRIRKVTASTGIITTIAGNGTAGYVASQDGGPATSAEIDQPECVAVDGSGNLYIADAGNNLIRKVTASTGIITTIAGNGTAGYVASQDGGPATSASLANPYGVTLDASGNLYIADAGNERIRVVYH